MLIEPAVAVGGGREPGSASLAVDASCRLLVIPGLHGSGAAHWQTWLQARHVALTDRVEQDDWSAPDLGRWAARIGSAVDGSAAVRRIAVAHSFGCLALVRLLQTRGGGIDAAVLVAPAEPRGSGSRRTFGAPGWPSLRCWSPAPTTRG